MWEGVVSVNMGQQPGGANQAMEILAYMSVEGAEESLDMVRRYNRVLTYLALFQFPINAAGEIKGTPDQGMIDLAHRYGIKVLLVMSNFVGKQFNPFIIRNVITHRDVERRLTLNLSNMLDKYNLDGVNLDLENMFPEDKDLFSAFVARLSSNIRARGKLVSIAVPAMVKDEPTAQWKGAFDYTAVGRAVDRVVLMTYEEHWAGSNPGPIASTPWVNGVLKYATDRINPAKLLLGLPLYGYDWPIDNGKAQTVTYSKAMNLAEKYGARIEWDNVMQAPHFTYTEDSTVHRVWFENAASVRAKVNLARQYGIKGLAVWELKLAFPEFWQYLLSNVPVAKV